MTKAREVEELVDSKSIQKKIRNINFNNRVITVDGMREMKDTQGSGPMMLDRKDKEKSVNKVDTKNEDILLDHRTIRGWDLETVGVYLSIRDKERNIL